MAIVQVGRAESLEEDHARPHFRFEKAPSLRPHEFFRSKPPGLRDLLTRRSPAGPRVSEGEPPLPPAEFNPDPGGGSRTTAPPPLLLFADDPIFPPDFGSEPLPDSLALPRGAVTEPWVVENEFHYRDDPPGALPPFTRAVRNRWFLGFGHWKRYHDPSTETPYQLDSPRTYHPYQQSVLKGDVPVLGQDVFANLTLKNFSLFEYRRLPVPSGISAAQPNSSEFFGRSEQLFFSNDTSINFDLFKGETAFRPMDWNIRLLGVYNVNYFRVKENNLLDADPRGVGFKDPGGPSAARIGGGGAVSGDVNPVFTNGGFNRAGDLDPGDTVAFLRPQLKKVSRDLQGTRYTTRVKDFFALQEAFGEVHLLDLSNNYDFISSRAGLQPFVSDFRGFIFSDSNLGVRFFGTADNNRYQYNLIYLNMLEKDTYSDLNTFESREQQILIANLFKQDFLARGYTAQWSFHMNLDEGRTHFDKNDLITRPALLGDARPHDVHAYYFGWTGDGHLGRFNLTHAFYQVLGEDSFNGLAGRDVSINAQMAALELSYDRDWLRLKLSGFYASGDADPTDDTARGFDSIQDNPFFIGGPFSWYVHQGFNLAGTAVNLKQRNSLVVDLRSSKTEGQSNFVNPGVAIVGVGADVDVTPKLRGFFNVNYILLPETRSVELALQTNQADNRLGLDCSLGFKYRPLLTENIVLSAGVGLFFPGEGYRDIYRRNTTPVRGFDAQGANGGNDSVLYNFFMTLTMTY